ncbi:MAG: hypothetical protein QXJ71_10395, partial [Pyrobaculum sp.]
MIPWLKKAAGVGKTMIVADVRLRGKLEADVYVEDIDKREVEYSPSRLGYVCTVEQCYADILTYGDAGP